MENYRLEKEYKVSSELFSEAYGEFQKKFVYPKSRIYMIIFTVIAIALLCVGIFAMSGASTRQKYIVYIAIVAAFAFAAREWYNPKKLRRSLTESVKALGEPVYKIGVGDKFVDISTVSDDLSDLSDEEKEDIPEDSVSAVIDGAEIYVPLDELVKMCTKMNNEHSLELIDSYEA